MLPIEIKDTTLFNDETQEFIYVKGTTLQLEHSLKSLHKWESKWKKPFLSREEKTMEETIDYIKCMTLNPKVDQNIYNCISQMQLTEITEYIQENKTATTFSKNNKPPSREIITAELIYYWMIQAQIPFECSKWHLSQLLTLIEVCSRKNAPSKKMSKRELATRNSTLNAQRRAKAKSRG